MYNKYLFIICFILIGCGSGSIEQKKSEDLPNIIVMYSDDHTAQSIGAYKDVLNYGLKLDHTPTPNIDRLAEGGMRFDNAFVTNSICTPSRAVMLSGLHSHMTGVLTNADSMPTDIDTFPSLLQKKGYQTVMIGKWHLKSEPQGFDYYEILYGQGPYYNPTMRTTSGDVDRQGHTTDVITDSALRWLKLNRNESEPFMMIFNHKAPHRNWLPSPQYLDDYKDRDLPEPSTLFYDYSGLMSQAGESEMEISADLNWGSDLKVPIHPETGEPNGGWQRLIESNRLTVEQLDIINEAYAEDNDFLYQNYLKMSEEEKVRWKYQRYIKDYLRVVRGVDDSVGSLISYLERENLLENTIIVYAGDNGFFLGEKGWFDKRWIYEESFRIPLIIHWPDGIESGSVNNHLVQNLDFAPTFLDVAGVDIPDQMQGQSMIPLLKNEKQTDWREEIYYHYFEGGIRSHNVPKHYGIRNNRYTLVHYYDDNEWELFDLKEDPEQLNNIYYDQEYVNIKKKLTEKIHRMQFEYGVKYPDNSEMKIKFDVNNQPNP